MSETNKMKDLELRRAAQAWKCASDIKNDKYANLTKSAPALIMNNGLMPTLAFFKQKGGEHELLLKHICNWLRERQFAKSDDFSQVMEELHGGDSLTYRKATEETLAFLKWLRQFASAVSKKD